MTEWELKNHELLVRAMHEAELSISSLRLAYVGDPKMHEAVAMIGTMREDLIKIHTEVNRLRLVIERLSIGWTAAEGE